MLARNTCLSRRGHRVAARGPFIPRLKPGAFWPLFCKAEMEDLTKGASVQMNKAADRANDAAGSVMDQAKDTAGDVMDKAKDILPGS